MIDAKHYLQAELYQLVRDDSEIFDFLQNGSLDGIWYWDLEQPEQEWMSPQFWRLFGYNPDQMPHLASAWQDIIFQDDLALAVANFEKHCADPSHPYDQIVRYKHLDGSTVWVRCRGIAIRDAEGTPKRMLGAHVDVTALKMAERRLDARNRELQHSNQDLAEFAYSASHDLRSPLNTLRGLITVLKEDHLQTLDAEGKDIVDMIETVSGRLHRLTDSVLTLADVTRADPEFQEVDCDALMTAVQQDLAYLLEEHGASLQVGELGKVSANEAMLRRVFQNLVENAVKYHRVGVPPEVVVECLREPDEVVFRFADNGEGIDAEDREAVFDMFQRSSRRRRQAGIGLGLNLCRKIVEVHGGRIWVESQSTPGTVICFSLDTLLSRQ